jgi:hypothetical protein
VTQFLYIAGSRSVVEWQLKALRMSQVGFNEGFTTCYQLMETDDRSLLEEWMSRWADLVEFEVHAVMTSQEAVRRIAPKMDP